MTEDVKQARRTGRAALVAHVRSLLTQRRLAVGGVVGLMVGIAVSSVLLSVLGEPASEDAQAGLGAVDVAATVLVGFGAGVLTLSICTLFWRAHDLPRQSKPPIKDVLLSERHRSARLRPAASPGTKRTPMRSVHCARGSGRPSSQRLTTRSCGNRWELSCSPCRARV
jgi:hypothetical protein